MGIKGTVRRSTDGHIIHANIDTDVIIAEEPPYGQFCILLLLEFIEHALSLHNYIIHGFLCTRHLCGVATLHKSIIMSC